MVEMVRDVYHTPSINLENAHATHLGIVTVANAKPSIMAEAQIEHTHRKLLPSKAAKTGNWINCLASSNQPLHLLNKDKGGLVRL